MAAAKEFLDDIEKVRRPIADPEECNETVG
jgi:hypothetical protein